MEKIVLHFLLFSAIILFANPETTEATISVKYEPTSNNFLQASISTRKNSLFYDDFFNTKTTSVFLKYKWDDFGTHRHVENTQHTNNVNEIGYLYFHCSNNKSSETIECYRDIRCTAKVRTQKQLSNVCVNGFGISWAYEGEYISSIILKNTTVECLNKYTVTCYALVDNGDFKTTDRSTTTTAGSTISSLSSTHNVTTEIPYNLPLIAIRTYSTRSKPSFITSTLPSVEQNPKSSSSDSTSVLAAVLISVIIVVVIVILIVIVFKRRRRQKESASKSKSPTVSLETNPIAFSDTLYNNQQDQRSDQHNGSKSKVCMSSNSGLYTFRSNLNRFTHLSDKSKTVHNLTLSIPESEYAVIEESQILTESNTSLSAHKDTDGYFNVIDDYESNFEPEPGTPHITEVDCSINTFSSDLGKVHSGSPQEEYTTINEIHDYTIIHDTDFHINHAAEHEYNNVKQNNTTIARNEPTKDVYSNLRENIGQYEHGYVDERVTMKTEEDKSSSLAPDNIYFILETEDTSDVEL